MLLLVLNEFHILLLYGILTALWFCKESQEVSAVLGWVMVGTIVLVNAFNLVFISVLQCRELHSKLKVRRMRRSNKINHTKYLHQRKELASSSISSFCTKEAWIEAPSKFNPRWPRKEDENYITDKFFCKATRSTIDSPSSFSLFRSVLK